MNYGYGKKSPSMGTPSVYSHVTTRSKSMKSVKIPWYQKRLLTNAFTLMDIQKGAMIISIYALVSIKNQDKLLYLLCNKFNYSILLFSAYLCLQLLLKSLTFTAYRKQLQVQYTMDII